MEGRLYFDGRYTGQEPPGYSAGFGWSLEVAGAERACGCNLIDPAVTTTVNVAEYAGLVVGLRVVLRDHGDLTRLEVMGDSQLVIDQVARDSGCWTPHLRRWRETAWDLMRKLERRGCEVTLKWIPREENARADALSREAFYATE
jgi:ribonuclease HI